MVLVVYCGRGLPCCRCCLSRRQSSVVIVPSGGCSSPSSVATNIPVVVVPALVIVILLGGFLSNDRSRLRGRSSPVAGVCAAVFPLAVAVISPLSCASSASPAVSTRSAHTQWPPMRPAGLANNLFGCEKTRIEGDEIHNGKKVSVIMLSLAISFCVLPWFYIQTGTLNNTPII